MYYDFVTDNRRSIDNKFIDYLLISTMSCWPDSSSQNAPMNKNFKREYYVSWYYTFFNNSILSFRRRTRVLYYYCVEYCNTVKCIVFVFKRYFLRNTTQIIYSVESEEIVLRGRNFCPDPVNNTWFRSLYKNWIRTSVPYRCSCRNHYFFGEVNIVHFKQI